MKLAIAFILWSADVFDDPDIERELDVSLEEIKGYMNQKSIKRLPVISKEQSIIRNRCSSWKRWRVDCKEEEMTRRQCRIQSNQNRGRTGQIYDPVCATDTNERVWAEKSRIIWVLCEEWIKSIFHWIPTKYEGDSKRYFDQYSVFMSFRWETAKVNYSVRLAGMYLIAYHKGKWQRWRIPIRKF